MRRLTEAQGRRLAARRLTTATGRHPDCWLAQFAPGVACSGGPLRRCHLLPRAQMRKELPHGLILVEGVWLPAEHPSRELRKGRRWSLTSLLRDERATVWGCGNGGQGHHGMLDSARTLRVPREAIPERVEQFVSLIGLTWWLDREYRPAEVA